MRLRFTREPEKAIAELKEQDESEKILFERRGKLKEEVQREMALIWKRERNLKKPEKKDEPEGSQGPVES